MTGLGEIALVSLGSNAPGGPAAAASFVLKGRMRIAETAGIGGVAMSDLFDTPAYPPGIGPDFVNAAMAFRTTLSAEALLDALHRIEAEAARERTLRWGQRTLDLDLLALGGRVAPDAATQTRWRDLSPTAQRTEAPDRLILPHPRLQDRAFVLVPLAQVAPDWVHPLTGRSVVQMRDALPAADVATVRVRNHAGEM